MGRTATSLEYLRSCLSQLESVTVWCSDGSGASRTAEFKVGAVSSDRDAEIKSASEVSSVKQKIALSLGQLGDMQAIDPLIQLLADADAGVKLHVITALKQLAPQAAHSQLQQLVTTKHWHRI